MYKCEFCGKEFPIVFGGGQLDDSNEDDDYDFGILDEDEPALYCWKCWNTEPKGGMVKIKVDELLKDKETA